MEFPTSPSTIADAVESGLKRAVERLEAEQAIYGLDVLDEVALHPILQQAFFDAGFGVFREQRYPADRGKRRISEGERCDFVLTPDHGELAREEARGTLFDSPGAVPLDSAFWLEVKVVPQFTIEGPNAGYASQLLSTVRRDVAKLSKEPGILHAGLLLIMFVRDATTAQHDLRIWQDRCLERGLPIGAPAARMLALNDRIGNAACAISVYPVAHL